MPPESTTPPSGTSKPSIVKEIETSIEADYEKLKAEAAKLLAKLESAFGALEKAGHPAVHEAKAQAAVVAALVTPDSGTPAAGTTATPQPSALAPESPSAPASSPNSDPSEPTTTPADSSASAGTDSNPGPGQ